LYINSAGSSNLRRFGQSIKRIVREVEENGLGRLLVLWLPYGLITKTSYSNSNPPPLASLKLFQKPHQNFCSGFSSLALVDFRLCFSAIGVKIAPVRSLKMDYERSFRISSLGT
jgi:hypothetical protein